MHVALAQNRHPRGKDVIKLQLPIYPKETTKKKKPGMDPLIEQTQLANRYGFNGVMNRGM